MDFKQQFSDDQKLLHVKIDNIQYYDEEDQEFYPATLDMFGYSREIILYSDGKPYKGIKSASSRDVEARFAPVRMDGDYCEILLPGDDEVTRILAHDFEKFKSHFREVNAVYENERVLFRNEVNSIVSAMRQNEEIRKMAINFLEDSVPIFLSLGLIIEFERILEKNFYIGRLLFLSEENIRFFLPLEESVINVLKVYLENGFNMFAQVIQENLGLSFVTATYSAYVFLYNNAIKLYSKQWAKECGNTFLDIETLNLDEAIERYSSIDIINHEADGTIAMFIYYLIDNNKFGNNNRNFTECVFPVRAMVKQYLERKKYQNFINKISRSQEKKTYTIDDIDLMTGQEFEQFVAFLFSKIGYEAEVTKTSGDQGIDVIAVKNGMKIGVQAKCYSGTVGNGAIQEAVAGKKYYQADKCMVVTNSLFTESAQQLASANSVVLWDRNILKEKIAEIFSR